LKSLIFERIYLAVSDDAEHWVRYLKDPIIDETKKIKVEEKIVIV
jgi:hypothetical protein